MRHARLCALLLGSTALWALPQAASAQSIEEILVTAQKRTESIREVPQAVSVLTGDQLDRLNVKEIADIAAYVPGLAVRGGTVGNRTIVVRGMATAGTSGGGESRLLGIYVDDVAFGSATIFSGAANFDLDISAFDLERVEVLNGPQGTLYGASSMAGVLKYVTKAPKMNVFEAKTQVSFGAVDGGDTEKGFRAMVNVPIINDKVAARLQVYHQDFAGYVDNIAPGFAKKDVGGTEQYGGRAQLLLTPTDQLSLKFMGMTQDMRRTGGSGVNWNLAANAPLYGDLDHLTQSTPSAEPTTQRFRVYSLTGDYDLGWAKATAVVAQQQSTQQNTPNLYTTLQAIYPQYGITSAPVAYGQKIFKNSGEFRIASPGGTKLEWLAGIYYDNEKIAQTQTISAFAGGAAIPVDFGHVTLIDHYRELAAFANATYHITDAWDVMLGARGARSDQNYTQITTANASPPLVANARLDIGDRSYTSTYAASTKYKFSDLGIVYARFSTGYRPGGPNVQGFDGTTGQPVGSRTLGPDKAKNYEVGAKITPVKWLGIDLAVYHIDWTDIQLNVQYNGISVRANGSKAVSDGSELTVQLQPIAGLRILGTLSYTDAHLEAPVGVGTSTLANSGDPLPGTPKWSGAINADYEFPVWSGWNGTVGGGWNYVGQRNSNFLGFASAQTAPNFILPSYNQINLRAGLSTDRYSVQFFARNVGDERGFASAGNTATRGRITATSVTFIQPRTMGVTFEAQF
ncbi:TonB-dependent receptor [Roseiterribacter gracilis]|uniref:TonB-dependent receptor n=1 Tax=Roseiterribacter gracilis TaxID=2812848 RepID=A0A8S8X8F1_9PROT|nr:TonB-dependent receptor [Rhodospirillales bacterium TMPK1]